MIELLSPAGSRASLEAAVQAGADAVYMGFGAFNARRNAKNFTDEEFADAGLHRAPANSIKNSFSSASLSIPRSLFMRRSSFWQRTTALLHQS